MHLLREALLKPKAIVLFLAHWKSNIKKVSKADEFERIYDFVGLPKVLYRTKYSAKESTPLTKEITKLFTEQKVLFAVGT